MSMFTIITVTKDNLAGLQETLSSVKAQSVADYEWVIIDGDSSDETATHIREEMDQSPALNIRFISEPDKGIYDAMNKGIDMAQGDYLIFMNAGDCFADDNSLKMIANEIEKSGRDIDFLYGDAYEVVDGTQYYKAAKSHTRYKTGLFTHHQAMVYRKAHISETRYDLRYDIAADYKFTLRCLMRARTVLYLPKPLCRFESGGVSQTSPLRGRNEQFSIRDDEAICTPFMNVMIYIRQSITWALRTTFPGLYWHTKRRKSSAVTAR